MRGERVTFEGYSGCLGHKSWLIRCVGLKVRNPGLTASGLFPVSSFLYTTPPLPAPSTTSLREFGLYHYSAYSHVRGLPILSSLALHTESFNCFAQMTFQFSSFTNSNTLYSRHKITNCSLNKKQCASKTKSKKQPFGCCRTYYYIKCITLKYKNREPQLFHREKKTNKKNYYFVYILSTTKVFF